MHTDREVQQSKHNFCI